MLAFILGQEIPVLVQNQLLLHHFNILDGSNGLEPMNSLQPVEQANGCLWNLCDFVWVQVWASQNVIDSREYLGVELGHHGTSKLSLEILAVDNQLLEMGPVVLGLFDLDQDGLDQSLDLFRWRGQALQLSDVSDRETHDALLYHLDLLAVGLLYFEDVVLNACELELIMVDLQSEFLEIHWLLLSLLSPLLQWSLLLRWVGGHGSVQLRRVERLVSQTLSSLHQCFLNLFLWSFLVFKDLLVILFQFDIATWQLLDVLLVVVTLQTLDVLVGVVGLSYWLKRTLLLFFDKEVKGSRASIRIRLSFRHVGEGVQALWVEHVVCELLLLHSLFVNVWFISLIGKEFLACLYLVSDVVDLLRVHHGLGKDSLMSINRDLQQLEDGIRRRPFGKCFHCMLYQIETLLHVIEADDGVDLVPVDESVLCQFALGKSAIKLLVEQSVEEALVHDTVTEVLCKRSYFFVALHGQNFVNKLL
jgi:hypothetical protein